MRVILYKLPHEIWYMLPGERHQPGLQTQVVCCYGLRRLDDFSWQFFFGGGAVQYLGACVPKTTPAGCSV